MHGWDTEANDRWQWQEVWLYSVQVMFLLHIQAGLSFVLLAAEFL